MPSKANELTILVRLKDLATKGFGRIARSAKRMAGSVIKNLVGITKKLGLMSVAIVAATVVLGRMALTKLKKLADEMDFLGKTSLRLGVTVESLSDFRTVAELSGLTIQDVAKSIGVFSRSLEDARKGIILKSDAFERLGLDVDALSSKEIDLTEVFVQVSNGLKDIESATEKTALVMELFGRSGTKVASILNLTEKQIRSLAKESRALSGTITKEGVKKFEDFNDSLTRVKRAMESVQLAVASKIIPGLTAAFNQLAKNISENRKKIVDESLKLAIQAGQHLVDFAEIFGLALTLVGAKLKFFLVAFLQLSTAIAGADAMFQKFFGTESDVAEANLKLARSFAKLKAVTDSLLDDIADPTKALRKIRTLLDALQQLFRTQQDLRGLAIGKDRGRVDTREDTQALREMNKELKKATTFFGGMQEGFEEFIKNIGTAAEFGRQAALAVSQQLATGLSVALTDAMLKVKTLEEAFKEFAKNTIRLLLQLINRMIILRLLGAGLGIFSSGGGSPGPVSTDSGTFHPTPSGLGGKGPGFARIGGGLGGFNGFGSGPSSGPQEGGGNTTINFNVSAIDAKGVAQFFRKNGKALADSLLNERRHNNQLKEAFGS